MIFIAITQDRSTISNGSNKNREVFTDISVFIFIYSHLDSYF